MFLRARRLWHLSILIVVVYLSLIGGAIYGDQNVILRLLHHLLMSGILIGWLIHLLRNRQPFPHTPLDIPLLAYAIWLMVATIFSHDWRVSLEQSWQYLLHVMLFYLAVWIMQRGRQRWIFEGLFLSAALVIVITLVELASWYFGLGFAGFEQGWFEIGGFSDPLPPYYRRAALAMNVATWLGNYAVTLLPLTLAWALTARRKPDRQALGLVAIGLGLVLILSLSRGALLGLIAVIGVGVPLWLWEREATRQIVRRYWWAVAAGLIIVVAIGGGLVYRLSQASGRVSADQGRLDLWGAALDTVQDHPITGAGVFQFGYFKREYIDLTSTTERLRTAHNLYLNTAAEIGLPGLAIMLALAGAFLWAWWRNYRTTYTGRRLRLIAILAALAGFSVQSLVDTFTYTSTVLPVLIMGAYVVAGHHTPLQIARPALTRRIPLLRVAILISTGVYLIWLLRIDAAGFRFLQSMAAMRSGDYAAALEKVEQAQALDPHFRLYEWQAAYVMGVLANDDPDRYLQAAIDRHERLLQADPHFEIGWINLSALRLQQGDTDQAIAAAARALAIQPEAAFWFQMAQSAEAAGQTEVAVNAYASAIFASFQQSALASYADSDFWDDVADYPARQQAMTLVYEDAALPTRLYLATVWNRDDRAADVASQLSATPAGHGTTERAYYAAAQGDYAAALNGYQLALETADPVRMGWLYSQIAAAYYREGNIAQAEDAIDRALFRGGSTETAYQVLAAIALEQNGDAERINALLARAAPVRYVVNVYDDSVFGRLGYIDLLPQLQLPGRGSDAYAAWFILAERYAADDDPETDPIAVYEAILREEPYSAAARALCGAACE